jgi:hypothetical protein
LCGGVKLGGSRGRPELTSQINAVAGASGIHHDAGEASFTCAKGPLKLTAYVLVDVVSISGQANAIWYAETIAGFLSPSPVAGIAAGLLTHMLKSVQVNPAWVARNSNMAVQVSQTAAQTNAAISDSIMRGWEDRGAATDRVMEEGSRARLGIDIYTVANDHNFYWVNPSGTVTLCSAFLVRFRIAGSDRAKWPASLFDRCCDSSRDVVHRTRGGSLLRMLPPYKPTRRLSLGRARHFVWAPRTPTSCCRLVVQKSISGVRIPLALPRRLRYSAVSVYSGSDSCSILIACCNCGVTTSRRSSPNFIVPHFTQVPNRNP